MILVTGATGKTGGEVLARLVERGEPVRALARDPGKAETLAAAGVDVVVGDMTDPAAMQAALEGTDRLFLMSPPDAGQPEMEGNTIDAAVQADVSSVVKLSALGAGPESPLQLGRQHAQIEEHLAASGLPHTVLRPGSFMQNFFNFAPTIRAEGTFYAPAADGAAALVDARDIAAVGTAVLVDGGYDGQVLTITGPEALTYTEAAEAMSAAVGRTIRYVDVPPEAAGQAMRESGMPDWLVEDLLILYSMQRDGYAAEVTPTVKEVARIEPRTFAQFATDYAPVFAS